MSSDVVDKIDGILEKNGTITKSNVKSNQKINTNLYFLDYNLVSANQDEYNEVIKYF